jgi:hypothetical protein
LLFSFRIDPLNLFLHILIVEVFKVGPSERKVLMLQNDDAATGSTMVKRMHSDKWYQVRKSDPAYLSGQGDILNRPVYSWLDDSTEPSHITSFGTLAEEAKLAAPETLEGYLQTSSLLIHRLLDATV